MPVIYNGYPNNVILCNNLGNLLIQEPKFLLYFSRLQYSSSSLSKIFMTIEKCAACLPACLKVCIKPANVLTSPLHLLSRWAL